MYTWIWRHLPGPVPAKAFIALLLVLAVSALLLFVVFPQVEPLLPFTDVTVAPCRGGPFRREDHRPAGRAAGASPS